MKRSEIIKANKARLAEAMVERYKTVLECDNRIQYKIFVWEDGEIECLEGPQGDNAYLAPKDHEPRDLFYVWTVTAGPGFNLWDQADHAAPEDPEEREAEEREIIGWLVDSYSESLDDLLDNLIREAEEEEDDEAWEQEEGE